MVNLASVSSDLKFSEALSYKIIPVFIKELVDFFCKPNN